MVIVLLLIACSRGDEESATPRVASTQPPGELQLVSAGYLDSEDHAYQPPASRGATNRLDLGALLRSGFGNRAGPLYAGTGGPDPVFQPIGGMMQIPLAFQRAIGDHITLEAEVSSVRRTADGVAVVYRETRSGAMRRTSADY